jgi:pimeloyl-ACP methyl ester carboxylesterase
MGCLGMPNLDFASFALHYQSAGESGPAVVLVHGEWADHHQWDPVVPGLRRSFRVIAYDRRGHSLSTAPGTKGSVADQAKDLETIVTLVGRGPCHLIASSLGAIIALRFTASRPDLVLSLSAHEPPLLSLVANDPRYQPAVGSMRESLLEARRRVFGGDPAGGARIYVDRIAVGEGGWAQLSPESRQTFVANSGCWLAESQDPTALSVDLEMFQGMRRPVMLTAGSASPPLFPAIEEKLAEGLWSVKGHLYPGAGHLPHVTHPAEFVETSLAFCAQSQ